MNSDLTQIDWSLLSLTVVLVLGITALVLLSV